MKIISFKLLDKNVTAIIINSTIIYLNFHYVCLWLFSVFQFFITYVEEMVNYEQTYNLLTIYYMSIFSIDENYILFVFCNLDLSFLHMMELACECLHYRTIILIHYTWVLSILAM